MASVTCACGFPFQQSTAAQSGSRQIRTGLGNVAFIGRHLAMAHPEYQIFDGPPPPPKPELIPVYPTTQGLGQARLRNLTRTLQQIRWPPGRHTLEKLLYLHNLTT